MRGAHRRTLRCRDVPQKVPACGAQLGLAAQRSRSPARPAFDSQGSRAIHDERARSSRVRTRTVIERCHDQSGAIGHMGRCVEQHHRVQSARHRQHDSAVNRQAVGYGLANRRHIARKHTSKVALGHGTGTPATAELLFRRSTHLQEPSLQTHGPLGTLWVSIGLGCFYIALIWLNTLLGFFLTPLFTIPGTWLMDKLASRRTQQQA